MLVSSGSDRSPTQAFQKSQLNPWSVLLPDFKHSILLTFHGSLGTFET